MPRATDPSPGKRFTNVAELAQAWRRSLVPEDSGGSCKLALGDRAQRADEGQNRSVQDPPLTFGSVRSFDLGPMKGIRVVEEDDPEVIAVKAEVARACAIAQALHSPDELIGGMGHADWRVRLEVIPRLLARARDDERTIPVLAEHLRDDDDPDIRGYIALVLGDFAPSRRASATDAQRALVTGALISAEGDPDSDVRWHVQQSLYEFGLRPWPGDLTPEIRDGDVDDFGTPADIAYRWGLTHLEDSGLAAIADFDEAIRLDPSIARFFVGRAYARVQLADDLSGAITDLDEAIRLDPGDARTFDHRGAVRQRIGDLQAAAADFSEAIRLDPACGVSFFNRARVWLELGDLERAISDLTEAIRLEPEDLQLWMCRADARRLNGDLEGALADHDEAVRVGPTDVGAYSARATARDMAGDAAGALSDYERAARLAPGDPVIESRLRALRRGRWRVLRRVRSDRRRRDAGRRYLLIAADGNASIGDINRRHLRHGYIPNDVVRQWCAETVLARERIATDLRRSTWPPDAQDEAEWLATVSTRAAAICQAGARAITAEEAVEILYANAGIERALANAANALRLSLDLPTDGT